MQPNPASRNRSGEINAYVINNIPLGVIKISVIHGYGLFARQDIHVGSHLADLDGQIVPWRLYKSHHNLAKEASGEWNALAGKMLLVRPMRTKYSFINHSRRPNCAVVNRNDSLLVQAIAYIPRGAELTLDYRCEPLPKEYLSGVGAQYL